MVAASLQIGQVARKTGLSIDTIRFYEKSGVVPRPARTEAGYRVYREGEVANLQFIKNAQQLGFSLNEIRELFSIQRQPQEACVHVRELIAQKVDLVRAKIAELQRMETELATALRKCRAALRSSPPHPKACPVLAEIAGQRRR
jgi:MerR family transcriptional regulator, mercuric resistance operon regulatory protein